MIYSNLIY